MTASFYIMGHSHQLKVGSIYQYTKYPVSIKLALVILPHAIIIGTLPDYN